MKQETITIPDDRSEEAVEDTRYLVREAAALFPSEEKLETAILALQEHGVDRTRISVLGRLPEEEQTGKARNWMHHIVDFDTAPRGAPEERGTIAEARTSVVALPGFGGVMLGLIAVMGSGGALGPAVAAAIIAGAAGSGAGYLVSRSIGEHHADQVTSQIEAGGLALWVTLKDDDAAILNILTGEGGKNVHVIEREAHWGVEDIPLATAQPDPFL